MARKPKENYDERDAIEILREAFLESPKAPKQGARMPRVAELGAPKKRVRAAMAEEYLENTDPYREPTGTPAPEKSSAPKQVEKPPIQEKEKVYKELGDRLRKVQEQTHALPEEEQERFRKETEALASKLQKPAPAADTEPEPAPAPSKTEEEKATESWNDFVAKETERMKTEKKDKMESETEKEIKPIVEAWQKGIDAASEEEKREDAKTEEAHKKEMRAPQKLSVEDLAKEEKIKSFEAKTAVVKKEVESADNPYNREKGQEVAARQQAKKYHYNVNTIQKAIDDHHAFGNKGPFHELTLAHLEKAKKLVESEIIEKAPVHDHDTLKQKFKLDEYTPKEEKQEEIFLPSKSETPTVIPEENIAGAAESITEPISLKIEDRGPEGAIINRLRKNTNLAKEFGWDGKGDVSKWASSRAHELYEQYAEEAIQNEKILKEMRQNGYLAGITEKEVSSYFKNPDSNKSLEDILLGRHAEMMRRIKEGTVTLDPFHAGVDLGNMKYLKAKR